MLAAGTTITIATGAYGMSARVTPALPTGRVLSVAANGQVIIVSAANAPAVDATGPWVFEITG